ncbi:MAG: hypothetical protein MUP22_07010 [Desulfobacterales bacterium]|nr:hypothetical protein [Desulfobacterales bacterium]
MNRDIFSNVHIVLILISIMTFSGCASMTPKPTPVNCPALDDSSMQGTIKGTWKGIALNAAEISGEFEITVAPDGKITGNYTGSVSGNISGCIDYTGNIQASGTGSSGIITWLGRMDESSGKLAARGTWFFGSGDGTWSGSGLR